MNRESPGLRAVVLLTMLGLAAWSLLLAVVVPLDYDEAVFTVVARGIVDGRWPYEDLFDHKPPLTYVWYLPGAVTESVVLQRLFAVTLCVASIPVLASIARRWLTARSAQFAVASYGGLLANPFLGIGTSIETYMLLPLIGAIAVPSAAGAGALLGVAVLTKPTALFFAPLLLIRWRHESWRAALACAAVIIVAAIAFAPVAGAAWEANVPFNRDFARHQALSLLDPDDAWQLFGVQPQAMIGALPLWIAAIGGLLAARQREARRDIVVWALCAAIAVKANTWTGGFEYAHYYILLVPPAALLAGVGLDAMLPRMSYRWVLGLTAAVSIALVAASLPLLARTRDDDEDVVNAIRATPGELYAISAPPQLYVEADRLPERRFFYDIPLLVREEWRDETMASLVACPPAVLVIDTEPDDELAWTLELERLYAERRVIDDLVVLTSPLEPCDRAAD